MKTIKKQPIAFYDISRYIESQIDYYVKEKDWFKETYYTFNDIDIEDITYEQIENTVWEDSMLYEIHYENLIEDINWEFKNKEGMLVKVEGSNMTWRNLKGTKEFILNEPTDILNEIIPTNTDYCFYLDKINDNEYEVVLSHHDSPTGEYYNIKLIDNE
jgi:hypothetical protein